MRLFTGYLLGLLFLTGPAWSLDFAGQRLEAIDRAQACHLMFVRLYQATLYSDDDGSTRCVDLEYLWPFSREDLARATLEFYTQQYGVRAGQEDAQELQRLVDAYNGVERGDRYRFCLSDSKGSELARGGESVLRSESTPFARRVLGLWVTDVDSNGQASWNFSTCKQRIF